MTGFTIDKFKGIAPRFSQRALPEGNSVTAHNVNLGSGQLRAMQDLHAVRGPTVETPVEDTVGKSTYPVGALSNIHSVHRAEPRMVDIEVDAPTDTLSGAVFPWSVAGPYLHFAGNTRVRITSSGDLPGGMDSTTVYYARMSGGDVLLADSIAGSATTISSTGSGVMTLTAVDQQLTPFWFVDGDGEYSRVAVASINDPFSRHVAARRRVVNTTGDAYPQLIAFEHGELREYRLGLPAPSAAPGVVVPPVPDGTGPEEIEYVSYISTYTDKFGYEGPPSAPTELFERVRPTSMSADEYSVRFTAEEGTDGDVVGAVAQYVGADTAQGPQTIAWRLDCTAVDNTDDASQPWYQSTASPYEGAGTSGGLDSVLTTAGATSPDEMYIFECVAADGGNKGAVDIEITGKLPNASGMIHLMCQRVYTAPTYMFATVEMVHTASGYNAALGASPVRLPKGGTCVVTTHPAVDITLRHDGGVRLGKGDSFYITYETDSGGAVIAASTVIRHGAGIFKRTGAVTTTLTNLRTQKLYGSKSWLSTRFWLNAPTGPVGEAVSPGVTYRPYTKGDTYYFYAQKAAAVDSGSPATSDAPAGWDTSGLGDDTPRAAWLAAHPEVGISSVNSAYDVGTAGIMDGTPAWRTYTPPGNAPWIIEVTDVNANGTGTSNEGRKDTEYKVLRPETGELTSVAFDSATDTLTKVAHRLEHGVSTLKFTAGAPGGVVTGATYYAVVIDADTFQLAETAADAMAATPVIVDLTTTGSSAAITVWQYILARKYAGGSYNAAASRMKANNTFYRLGEGTANTYHCNVRMNDPGTTAALTSELVVGDRFYFYLHEKAVSFGNEVATFTLTTDSYELLTAEDDAREVAQTSTFTADAGTDTLTFATALRAPPNTAVQLSVVGGSLPAGLEAAATYYLLSNGSAVGSSQITSELDGAAIDFTTAGSGTMTVTVVSPQWLARTGQSFTNPYIRFRIDADTAGFDVGDAFISSVDATNAIQLTFPDVTDLLLRHPNLVTGFVNIYRSNTGGSGSAFQFARRFPISVSAGIDTTSSEFLEEVCPSTTWIAPPDDAVDPDTGELYYAEPLQKVVQFGNGVLAGYTGRTVCFSEPGVPHAWPSAYRYSVRHDIIDVCPVRDGLLVLTTAAPVLMVGDHPSSVGQIALDARYGCVNARSVVAIEGEAFYASREGLIKAGSSGVENVTLPYIDEKTWRTDFNPTTYRAFSHEGRYIARTGVSGEDFNGCISHAEYFIVAATADGVEITTATVAPQLAEGEGAVVVTLHMLAAVHTAGASDGKTYLLAAMTTPDEMHNEILNSLYEFEWDSDSAVAPLVAQWESGKVSTPRAVAYQTLRCRETGDGATISVKDKAGAVRAVVNTMNVDRPVRIPGGWKDTEVSVLVETSGQVESLGIWDSMAEAQ